MLRKAVLLVCAFIVLALFSCNPKDNSGESSSTRNPNWPELSENGGFRGASQWSGVFWHTLFLFDRSGATRNFKIPSLTSNHTAIFDYCVTEQGEIWIPVSRMDFGDPRLICLDFNNPGKISKQIVFDDVEPRFGLVPVPFNIECDNEWLYVLRKYTLSESMLTRINIKDNNIRQNLRLPVDGGGYSGLMLYAETPEKRLLAIGLHEAVAIIDCSAFDIVAVYKDNRLYGQWLYSRALNAFILAVTAEQIYVNNPDEAGLYKEYVLKSGLLMYYMREQIAVLHCDQNYLLEFKNIQHDSGFFDSKIGSSSITALTDAGDYAISLSGVSPGLVSIDLINMRFERSVKADIMLNGQIRNIGGDIFVIGGNVLYDFKRDEFYYPPENTALRCDDIEYPKEY